jgi:DNA helicase-2/ATP-dependent DNA helicase PcrA
MTIHNGKGLEFTAAFIAGLEETLFPHINVSDDSTGLEEERRLFYVGMTRAKDYLYITGAATRYLWGVTRSQRASRFLREIPLQYVEKVTRKDTQKTLLSSPKFSTTGSRFSPQVRNIPQKQGSTMNPEDLLTPGDLVHHSQFGIGKIQEVYQGGAGLMYKIRFDQESEEKTIVAKYAQLTKW